VYSLLAGVVIVATALVVDRLGAWHGPRAAVFFWRDGAERAKPWQRLAAGLRAKIALYEARAANRKTQ